MDKPVEEMTMKELQEELKRIREMRAKATTKPKRKRSSSTPQKKKKKKKKKREEPAATLHIDLDKDS